MYLGVKAVEPKENYMLLLTFENDEQRLFDMKPYLDFGTVFRALKNPAMFNTVHVFADTVGWNNNVDLDPEILYPNDYLLISRKQCG